MAAYKYVDIKKEPFGCGGHSYEQDAPGSSSVPVTDFPYYFVQCLQDVGLLCIGDAVGVCAFGVMSCRFPYIYKLCRMCIISVFVNYGWKFSSISEKRCRCVLHMLHISEGKKIAISLNYNMKNLLIFVSNSQSIYKRCFFIIFKASNNSIVCLLNIQLLKFW